MYAVNQHIPFSPLILSLDRGGRPVEWLHWKKAVAHLVRDDVVWSLGEVVLSIHGGHNRFGVRSVVEVPPIIAINGADAARFEDHIIGLSNDELFARDSYTCMYCGESYQRSVLTRDHVIPLARGGPDIWGNVVCSCSACNNKKACRTPEEAGMPLLALPFAPSHIEGLLLKNRRILSDQMDFLHQQLPRSSRYLLA